MKNKYLLTVKYALASAVLGIFGFVGFSAINEAPASAMQDIELSVIINNVPFNLNVVSPTSGGAVGDSFSLDVSGQNINTVAVYVDLNGDNTYAPNELLGTFNIGTALGFGPGFLVGPVTIPAGTLEGTYNMKVVGTQYNGGNDETSSIVSIDYSFSAPRVDNIAPDFGPTEGGNKITLTGRNFDSNTEVFIGDKACANVVVVSSTKITCVAPAGSAGHATVTVKGPNGIYTNAHGYMYVDYSTGGGGSVLPRVPNTGLFRVGNTVVMSSDFMIAGLLVVIIILGWIIVKRNKECKKPARKPTKNGAKAATAKRVRTKKGTTKRK
jgi:hypothetical protein